MPVSEYYGGKGDKVMTEMKKRYGKKKGKSVFYAVKTQHEKKLKAQKDGVGGVK